jgi:magnesium transporter
VLKLLDYPENSAGAYMTTAYASLNAECSIRDALEQLRIQAINKETIYYVYVVDENRKLIGFVSLQDIIIARPSMRVREIMNNRLIFARVDDDIETTARNLIHYDFLALPVVDHEERLVGIITFDDILDVVQEEATEDMYHLANLDTDEKINTPLMESVRLRIPWLVVNLGTALVAASTVNLFGKTIEHVVAIASMMTIIATLGGNSGNQALTVVVRSLALGEASKINARDVVLKNVGVGFMNGLICGALLALISYLWFGNLLLSAITWAATAVNQIIAGFFGTLTPLALRRFNLDPALGSSVMVTTATDTGGFFILLSLATLFLHTLTGGL